jgi:hypothetical protein
MKKITIVAAFFAILSGCATNPNSIDAHLVKVGDIGDLDVKDLRSARVNNFLNVQATVENDSGSIKQLYYRCKFYDGNKFQVGTDSQWQPVRVYGKSTQDISCVATEATAIDFKLEVNSTGTALKVYN